MKGLWTFLVPSCCFFWLINGCLHGNDTNRDPGVLCTDLYPLDSLPPKAPLLPDIFTVSIETVFLKEPRRQLWKLHVDRTEKIVVHKLDIPSKEERFDWFYSKILRDFRSGLEFRISNGKQGPDCIVEPINNEFELTAHNLKRFILEHAKLMLNFDPSFVNYWGKRSIRNLEAEIWLHESLGEFVSEFGFGNDSTLPISVATFSREAKPELVAISNIYADTAEITDGTLDTVSKPSGHPDVTECLDQTPLLLRIILQAPYAKLKGGAYQVESIRRAVAGLAGISLLRVTDLALSEYTAGLSAFWFSLRQILHFQELSASNNSQTIVYRSFNEAYRILRDVTNRHDVTLRVDLNNERTEHMLVSLQRGSLMSVPRALHPAFNRNPRGKPVSVSRAIYTSGSMAGAGLAMFVLGLAVGLLLGFMLWNRYVYVRQWRNGPIPYCVEP